ncbi:hypothetical protein CcI49_36365 [Frankia sp. CcI49]|nr:hypothetical protein ACG83_05750 [Frankia sp. R43]ONH50820.1 hypothetical protein CcI49_36365 [Frankia sp. CcI49]
MGRIPRTLALYGPRRLRAGAWRLFLDDGASRLGRDLTVRRPRGSLTAVSDRGALVGRSREPGIPCPINHSTPSDQLVGERLASPYLVIGQTQRVSTCGARGASTTIPARSRRHEQPDSDNQKKRPKITR